MTSIFKLAASTALAGMVAVGAAAQGTTPGATADFVTGPTVGDFYASDLIGADVVTPDVDAQEPAWDEIGAVDDLLIGDDGMVRAVLVDVGGFLGIGSKTVALPVASVDIGREEDGAPLRVAVDQSREALENAPEYEPGDDDWALGDRAESAGESVSAAASSAGAAIEDGAESVGDALSDGADAVGDAAESGADRMGLTDDAPRDDGAMTAAGAGAAVPIEELQGAQVRDVADENVGSVAEIVDGPQGRVAVMDIGGILGLGAHRIAMPLDDLDVTRDLETDTVTVRVSATGEQLREMPAYEG